MQVPYILTNKTVTVIVHGKSYTADSSNLNFNEIVDLLKSDSDDFDSLVDLFDITSKVSDYVSLNGDVIVRRGVVKYKGEFLDLYVTQKLIEFMRNDLPVQPMINFIERLMANPSRRAVTELYSFLEHKNMPLTPEGYFLAYKGVRADYRDIHSGRFDNSVGQVLEMTRWNVCDDANISCSRGFHAGSYEYANNWAGPDGHLMIVKIDPADVVSIPKDSNCQKLRTCKYEVVAEEKDRKPLDGLFTDEYSDDDYGFQNEDEDEDGYDEYYDENRGW